MRIAAPAIYMLSITIASTAAGTDHIPFTEGVIYEYERIPQALGTFRVWFSGMAEVGGTSTHVQLFDDGQQLFWSENPEGDKFIHGTAFRLEAPVVFSPPILAIDEPLSVGKTWDMDIQDSDGIAFHIRYEVTAFADVTVPAGTFPTFTIRQAVAYPQGSEADKIRRLVRGICRTTNTSQQVEDDYYVDGVGRIQSAIGSRTDRLRSFRTVGVQPSTWTRIRMLYR